MRDKEYKYHFTYLITDKRNIKESMFYGGVHSCHIDPIKEIGINYFGSSKHLTKKEQKLDISNFEYVVMELFKTRTEAEIGEIKMLTENDAKNSLVWYNRCNGFKSGTFNNLGNKASKETRKKQSDKLKGTLTAFDKVKGINRRVTIQEFADDDNLVGVSKGRKATKETKKKMSISKTGENHPNYGKTQSDAFKKNQSDTQKGRKQPIVICPHCSKVGGISLIKRYHFDNCSKMIKINSNERYF